MRERRARLEGALGMFLFPRVNLTSPSRPLPTARPHNVPATPPPHTQLSFLILHLFSHLALPPFRPSIGSPNPLLPRWGFPEHVTCLAVNPGLADPFDPDRDVTLNNPKYWGLMQGKLDWVLLRGLKVRQAAQNKKMRSSRV